MKIFKIFITAVFLFSYIFSSYSQTQSLWSRIRNDKNDSVGLNALQYQAPLWGSQISFFDTDVVKGINDYAQVDTWLVRDFNNDGFADIFLTFYVSGEKVPAPFILLMYDKNSGTFKDQSYRLKNNIGQPDTRKAMAADFNGDGILDVVAVSHPECDTCRFSYFDIVLSNPDTTWTQKSLRIVDRFKCEGYNHGVAVGDIDDDGDIDIVLANENSCNEGSICYINDGKGNFIPNPVSTIYRGQDFVTNAWTTELADINGDGCLDLFYWHDTLNTRILYGNCKETFDNAFQYLGPLKFPYVMDYDVRDIDGDGDFDLILTTTDYTTGWQLVFLENKGNDSNGKVIWSDRTEDITQSLKIQGFYPDGDLGSPYIHVVDINLDRSLDIISQNPLSNTDKYFSQFILLGDNNWNFKYKKLPFAESPKIITSAFEKGNVILSWDRVKQNYSTSDGGINKWAIYVSDNPWGDRSQVSTPIIVSSTETITDSGTDQYFLNPTSKEMYIRISPIDSTGIEWPLSSALQISILPPSISSASICDGNNLTISGDNFVGVSIVTVDGIPVVSYNILSDKTLYAVLDVGQSGSISVTTVAGNAIFSDVKIVVSPSQDFTISGTGTPLKGSIETYSVPETTGVNFDWSFPDGWEQISGSNTNIVTVKVGTYSGIIAVIPSAICGNLAPISLPVSVYTYVPDDNFQKGLRDLGIDLENKPDSVLTSSILSVTDLNLDSLNIADLTGIQDFVDLRTLKCRNNNLNELNLTWNELLEELYCGNSIITSINISKNIALRGLSCEGNLISNLDITKNTMLNFLVCDGIPITSLNISNNKELTLLSIFGQEINSIDLSNNTKLNYFSSVNCRLTELEVSENPHLSLLNCSGNQLANLDVSKNPDLEYLDCSINTLSNLNIKNGKNELLTKMYANSNPSLTCINVDNPSLSATYSEWNKDATASYSENCISTGIETKELDKPIVVNPNPSNGIFKIEGLIANQKNEISVYTIDGRLIRKLISNSRTETIDLSGQVSGTYLLYINGIAYKIMKE